MKLAYPDPALTDGVVLLRPWTPGDLTCVEEAGADPTIPAGTSVPAVFSPEEGLAFIERQGLRIKNGEGVSMAVVDAGTGRAVGLIWLPLRPQPGVVGLGYWVVPRARGLGFGTRAVRLAADWALTLAGAARVEAWVELENEPSQRLLTAAGFVREGVLRSFLHLDDRQAGSEAPDLLDEIATPCHLDVLGRFRRPISAPLIGMGIPQLTNCPALGRRR